FSISRLELLFCYLLFAICYLLSRCLVNIVVQKILTVVLSEEFTCVTKWNTHY
ncbi:unnamed protein product, partial [Brassica oleracea]